MRQADEGGAEVCRARAVNCSSLLCSFSVGAVRCGTVRCNVVVVVVVVVVRWLEYSAVACSASSLE
jgi:hypothetical protein